MSNKEGKKYLVFWAVILLIIAIINVITAIAGFDSWKNYLLAVVLGTLSVGLFWIVFSWDNKWKKYWKHTEEEIDKFLSTNWRLSRNPSDMTIPIQQAIMTIEEFQWHQMPDKILEASDRKKEALLVLREAITIYCVNSGGYISDEEAARRYLQIEKYFKKYWGKNDILNLDDKT